MGIGVTVLIVIMRQLFPGGDLVTQDCQSPEIVWENSGWKKANCFKTKQKLEAVFFGMVRWELTEVATISYPGKR